MKIIIKKTAGASRAVTRWQRRLAAARPEPAGNAPLTLGQLFEPLLRRWPLVVCLAVLGLTAAVFIARSQKPVYESTALLEIQPVNDNFFNLREMAVSSGDTLLEPYLLTQVKILQSPELLQRVAAKLHLHQVEEFSEGGGAETVHENLSRAVNARISGATRIIEITAESTDPALARALANTSATEHIAYTLERRLKHNRETAQWLGEQLRDLKASFERSEQQVQEYARGAGLVFTSDQSVAESRLRQLQESLSRSQADRIGEQTRLERALASPPESLPEVLDDASLRDYQVKLTELKRQLAERSSTLEPAHYRIRELRAQVSELETAIERHRANVLKRIRNQYDSALKREQMESAAYAEQTNTVAREAAKSVRYKSLKQEADSNRQLYEAMLQKVKEAGIASAVKASNIELLSAAPLPETPSKPRLPLYAAAGVVCGLAAGIGLCFLMGAPPAAGAGGDVRGYRELGAFPNAFDTPRELIGASSLCPELASLTGEDSPAAEAARSVLTAALQSSAHNGRPQVLAITSTGSGEGKTTLACNMALALARMQQRVLLIDAHVRKPKLCDIFGIPNRPGFPELIAQLHPGAADDLVWRMAADLSELDMPGLHVLPAEDPAAAGLLCSPELPAVLRRLKRHFNYVLIDAPPLTRLEARTLSRAADGVVMVVGALDTAPDSLQAALARLAHDGANVLGIVVNDRGAQREPLLLRGVLAPLHPLRQENT